MSETAPESAPSLPPHAHVIQMAMGYWVSRVLYMIARLGIADLLADGPRSAEDLAEETGMHARSLYRLMRTSTNVGILSLEEDGRFALTPLGESMKTGAPGSARSTILVLGGQWVWRAMEEFPHSIATGGTAMEKAWGMGIFDYLAEHPEEASLFSETMVGIHGAEPPAVAAAYDFSEFGTIVDVGGATGNLLAHVLARHPEPRGVLFDRPHVVADAPAFLEARGVADRVTIEEGNFFDRVPEGGDAYMMSHIIHDWTEEQCLTILGHCRAAMKPDGKLLIVEMVIPDGNEPHQGKMTDIIMLTLPGGEERTEREYAELLEKAGFRLTRVVPTESAVSVVEAVLA